MALDNKLDNIITNKFRITPKVTLPVASLTDGDLDIKDGILCVYDATRVKWLSVARQTLIFGRDGATNNQYLNYAAGVVPSNVSGYRLPFNACITSMSVQTSDVDSYVVRVRRDNSTTNMASLTVTGATGKSENTSNTNLAINNFIQCYLEYTGVGTGCENPVVMIELAWRL